MPIVALFYNENGLDDFDIFLLQAIYSVSVAIMEIPSGYMADVVGRKKTLILGSIMGTFGYLIYSVSNSFSGFLAAEIILGIGGSFISGADSAMLFDSLAATKRQHRYLQFEGRITSLGNFAETAAAVCGGLIAALLSYRAVYLSQAMIAALAVPAALLLLEPPRDAHIARPGLQHILSVCKNSILTNRKLSSAIFLSSTTGIATLCMAWCSQIYFVANGFTEVSITPLWVSLNLTVAIVAAFASAAMKILGKKVSFLLIIFYLPATYIFLGWLPLIPALVCLFLFYAVRGYATPMLKDLINQYCSSSTRATVLSIRSLVIRLGFALLGPSIGLVSDGSTLSFALILSGILLLILAMIAGSRLIFCMPDVFHKNA
ncbi:MAG: MFS transporter [Desulfobulbaceae bacterium]|nr:MFS transporter [Desulfobulbaceae bacterium]